PRTCAMHASGSAVTSVAARLWRITGRPCRPLRGGGRSWVWAAPTSAATAGMSPSRAPADGGGGSAHTATPAPHGDGPPPAACRALGDHRTGPAPATAGLTWGTGLAQGWADWCAPRAPAPAWCAVIAA